MQLHTNVFQIHNTIQVKSSSVKLQVKSRLSKIAARLQEHQGFQFKSPLNTLIYTGSIQNNIYLSSYSVRTRQIFDFIESTAV